MQLTSEPDQKPQSFLQKIAAGGFVLTLGVSVGASSAAPIQPPPPIIYQSVMGRIGMFIGEKLIHKVADKVVAKGTDKVIRIFVDESMIDKSLRRGFGWSKEQSAAYILELQRLSEAIETNPKIVDPLRGFFPVPGSKHELLRSNLVDAILKAGVPTRLAAYELLFGALTSHNPHMRDTAHSHLAFILRDAALLEKRNKEAQTRLKNAGFDPGPIDGVIGPKTEAAIRAFQIKHRLPAIEKLDEETLNTLGVAPIYPLLRKPQQPLTDRVS